MGLASPLTYLASGAWSVVNLWRRRTARGAVDLGVRTIGVGNLQAGGAGKTPLVMQIGREAIARGLSIAVLSRGYRGQWERDGAVIAPGQLVSPAQCGDEAALVHAELPTAWLGIGADRVAAFSALVASKGSRPDLVILDDSFQNFQIRPSLRVLAVTSSRWGTRLFRDFSRAAVAADLVVWTKGEAAPSLGPAAARVHVRFVLAPAPAHARPLHLVTGVGDAEGVVASAERAGYVIGRHHRVGDHVGIAAHEWEKIRASAREVGEQVAMTGKDWARNRERLSTGEGSGADILILEPAVEFQSGRENWDRILWGNP